MADPTVFLNHCYLTLDPDTYDIVSRDDFLWTEFAVDVLAVPEPPLGRTGELSRFPRVKSRIAHERAHLWTRRP